ncbi:MAG: hypothetical protein ACREO8_05965 [Luteimonas sp.]
MTQRGPKWLLVAIVAVIAIVTVRGCRNDARRDASTPAAATPPSTSSATTSADNAEADAVLRVRLRQRDEAMYAAVSALQRYLAALGRDDHANADTFWVDKHPPTDSVEADLRSLKGLHGLRIESGTPKPLDSDPVPRALEIPITLRASLKDSPMRHYTGWYRLRRASSDDRWEITSASVDAVPAAQ